MRPVPEQNRKRAGGHKVTSIMLLLILMLTRILLPVGSQDQSFPGTPTCQVQDVDDMKDMSLITCEFPVSISFFHVSIYQESGNYPDIILSCSPCHMEERFSSFITPKFPRTQTEGTTWVLEVKRSPVTAGSYTCYGLRGPEAFHSSLCNLTDPVAANYETKDAGHTAAMIGELERAMTCEWVPGKWTAGRLNSSALPDYKPVALVSIPFAIGAIVVVCILYRRGNLRCTQRAATDRKQREKDGPSDFGQTVSLTGSSRTGQTVSLTGSSCTGQTVSLTGSSCTGQTVSLTGSSCTGQTVSLTASSCSGQKPETQCRFPPEVKFLD